MTVTVKGLLLADRGVYINLDKRQDRNFKIQENLKNSNIEGVVRVKAQEDEESPQRALFYTTLQIYKDFIKSKKNTLLVLEDDCEFLETFDDNVEEVLKNIQNSKWDLFWLGCLHRRAPAPVEENCYQVSSVSYAHSYIITRQMAKDIVDFYEGKEWNTFNTGVDEMLTLFTYGPEMAENPWKYDFYEKEQPLNSFSTRYRALCHYYCLTTQYTSYSDLWKTVKNWGWKIKNTHPSVRNWTDYK